MSFNGQAIPGYTTEHSILGCANGYLGGPAGYFPIGRLATRSANLLSRGLQMQDRFDRNSEPGTYGGTRASCKLLKRPRGDAALVERINVTEVIIPATAGHRGLAYQCYARADGGVKLTQRLHFSTGFAASLGADCTQF